MVGNTEERHVIVPFRTEPGIEDLKRLANAILNVLSWGYANTTLDLRDIAPVCAKCRPLPRRNARAASAMLTMFHVSLP